MLLIDAQLSPSLAVWVKDHFGVDCISVDILDTETRQMLIFFSRLAN